MNVTVILSEAAGASAAPSLPATALFQKDKTPAVWIVKQDQTLELRPVVVSRYESDRVVISQGLKSGERVVTAGVHRLAAGERVRMLEGEGR
jgi:multidrug efflux pump subunit AcrA (membrane-fusion protein)